MGDLDLLKLAAEESTNNAARSDSPNSERVAAAFSQLEILELLGVGGMGTVYKARQKKLDRLVALKILTEKTGERDFLERFEREGRLLAKLNHPNIVAVHDFGESDGLYYLLMEYVEGVNLRQAMREEKFTPDQALAIVPAICDALFYAHTEGILHRDIKPENILLDTKGRVKIADFGISRFAENDVITKSGEMLGTPFYAAPEQLESAGSVDHRADIYSLGVVFYELLTGELPIGRFAPPSEKSTASRSIDPIVLKSLEKEREKRQQSAEELKSEVEHVTKQGIQCENRKKKPNRLFVFSGVLLILLSGFLLLAGFVYSNMLWNEYHREGFRLAMLNQTLLQAESANRHARHESEIVELQRKMMESTSKEEQQLLSEQINAKGASYSTNFVTRHGELERQYQMNRNNKRGTTVRIVTFTMFTSSGLALFSGIIGSVLCWVHLNRIRRLREKPGFFLGLVFALFYPVLIIWGGSLAVFVLPYPGGVTWTIANLVGIGSVLYLVRTTYRWAKG